MTIAGTGADAQHSCGEQNAIGKAVWHHGSSIDGGGMLLRKG